jgi:hypothetical protein
MHREEREFSVFFQVVAEFDEDYAGDDDGFAWHERFEQKLKPRLVSAIFDVLRSDPEWEAVAAPRGRDPDRALEIQIRHKRPVR